MFHKKGETYLRSVKKAEHWRIDAFELWCSRRLLRVPWTARRSNRSILKEISSEYSLGVLMLKLKLQYFGHLMWRTDSLEKTLMLGKTEGKRRSGHRGWGGWMVSLIQWTWVWASSTSSWRAAVHAAAKNHTMTEWLNWLTDLRNWQLGALSKDVGFLTDIYGV